MNLVKRIQPLGLVLMALVSTHTTVTAEERAPTPPTPPVAPQAPVAPSTPYTNTVPTAGVAVPQTTAPSNPISATPQICTGFGPQTPRDIDQKAGENKRIFSLAPRYQDMNLCNIHFHVNAEHKAKSFSILAPIQDGKHSGYQCEISKSLTPDELRKPNENFCKGVQPGDTVEVHWVHTSCEIKPGKGLGSCLSDTCGNPNLRVETQVFTVVNDPNALNFNDMRYDGNVVNGYHQAKSLPNNTGTPVEFLGSTTGTKYDSSQQCSPLQVSWSVRPQCAKLDINSLSQWCKGNVFAENYAHGVRPLVTDPHLLAPIK